MRWDRGAKQLEVVRDAHAVYLEGETDRYSDVKLSRGKGSSMHVRVMLSQIMLDFGSAKRGLCVA